MATFKVIIQKHQERTDGKFPVRIRITWKREIAYIKTEYYVTAKQTSLVQHQYKGKIVKSLEIKDVHINRELNNRIAKFEDIKIKKLGQNIDFYSAKELADYFVKQDDENIDEDIDFVEFTNQVIGETKNKGTADLYGWVLSSIKKFVGREKITFSEITLNFLKDYEKHLYNSGVNAAVNNYMRTFRTLLYKARDTYNDEERGEIRVLNPFKRYEIPRALITEKQALSIEQIKLIRDKDDLEFRREKMALDVFMLSFYLVGMNSADLYNVDKIENKRLLYNRTKTKGRRIDKAFISIKIEPEVKPLLEKYKDASGERIFSFYKEYSNFHEFNKAINLGLKKIVERANEKKNVLPSSLKFYAARHSWATIARNDCGVSKDDIHEALNHSDPDMKITDGYIKKDWSAIDRASRKVLDILK